MGQNWQDLSVPVNTDIPDVAKIKELISFSNMVPFNLVRNGDMEYFSSGPTSVPDNWILSGSGATVAQESTVVRLNASSVKLTYGIATARLSQSASSFAFYKGKFVKAWAYVYSSNPNIARITIDDGIGQQSSAFHPGDGTWRFLSCSKVVSNSATKVEMQLNVEGAGFAYFDVCVLVDFDSMAGFLPNLADAAAAASVAVARTGTMATRGTPGAIEFFYASDVKQLFFFTTDPTVGDNGWVTVGG